MFHEKQGLNPTHKAKTCAFASGAGEVRGRNSKHNRCFYAADEAFRTPTLFLLSVLLVGRHRAYRPRLLAAAEKGHSAGCVLQRL
jgi:hypothetical protein